MLISLSITEDSFTLRFIILFYRNPNMPKKEEYLNLNSMFWNTFPEEWPEFDPNSEKYIQLGSILNNS